MSTLTQPAVPQLSRRDLARYIDHTALKPETATAQIVQLCKEARRAGNALTKVIIEAALLTDEEKKLACQLAREAGAEFVKTSTGFSIGGATTHDVALMREVVGPDVGVKAAGGIKTYADMLAMIAAGPLELALAPA